MSSNQSSVNQETIEQTKQQIRALVNEISQLSKSDLSAEEYYPAFLHKIIQALAAVGGAVWMLGEGQRMQLTYQINLSEGLLDPEAEEATKHLRLLGHVAQSGEPALIPPLSGPGDERAGGNPTRFLLVLSPLTVEGRVEGMVEIFQRSDSPPQTQRGYLRFLVQMCELANEWLKSHKLKQFSDRHSLWSQADHFARLAHESLDLRETSYTVVNEGRRMIGCDRVSVAIKKGTKCYVEAVSGQDTIESRSNVIVALNRLATTVVATGEPLWYHGSTEDLPPQIEEAVEAYVDESYAKTLVVLPIRRPRDSREIARESASGQVERDGGNAGEVVGALIVELLESDLPKRLLESRLDLVYEHGARALANSLDHNNLFLMPVWRTLGKASWVVHARTLPKTLSITAAILIALIGMFVIRKDFNLKAKGELQPVSRRDVFVAVPGEIVKVAVKDGAEVKEGDLLAQLRNPDLEVQLTNTLGELQSTQERLRSISNKVGTSGYSQAETEPQRDSLFSEVKQLRARESSLREQFNVLRKKKEALAIRAPIDGTVMLAWDVEKSLEGRPVTEGQVLMTMARPEGDWELELYMPERRMGHVYRAIAGQKRVDLPVEFILATDPGTYRYGVVKKVHGATQMHEEEGHSVRMLVSLSPEQQKLLLDPRPGATVTAKVNCGRASLAYAWFHEAVAWLETNVLFRLF